MLPRIYRGEIMAIKKEDLFALFDTVQKDWLIVEENGNEITIQFIVEEEL